MRTSILRQVSALALAALTLTAAPALAQDDEGGSEITVTGNASIVSDYRFRGVSFSDDDFAIQGGIDASHSSGFYVGVWGSSLEDSPTFGHTEIDLYGGWTGNITEDVTLDVGLLYFWFPNGEDGAAGPSDFFEPYASLSTTIGPVGATVGVNYAWDQSALGDQSAIYVYSDWSLGIPDTPITLNAHIGFKDDTLSAGEDADWSLGASYQITPKLSAGIAYIDTDAPQPNDVADSAIVATLGVSF